MRAGFGITNDPYSLARPLRTNHPAVLNLLLDAPNSLPSSAGLSDGIPLIPDPDLGNGIISVPSPITVFTLPDKFERGHIRSWNVAFQRELRWGFVGEAAYVGTRQIDQLGFRELNWSPIGGGQAGRQLNQKFGRTGQTRLIAPIGDSRVRCTADPPRPSLRQRHPDRRELHLLEVDRDRGQRRTATARCGSTSPITTRSTDPSATSIGRTR